MIFFGTRKTKKMDQSCFFLFRSWTLIFTTPVDCLYLRLFVIHNSYAAFRLQLVNDVVYYAYSLFTIQYVKPRDAVLLICYMNSPSLGLYFNLQRQREASSCISWLLVYIVGCLFWQTPWFTCRKRVIVSRRVGGRSSLDGTKRAILLLTAELTLCVPQPAAAYR